MRNKLVALVASSLLAGCGIASPLSGQDNASLAARDTESADWTILVHQVAANDLESYALKDLNEMEAGLNSERINLIVLFDGKKDGSSKVFHISHDPKGLNKTLVSQEVDDGGAVIPPSHNIDSGDPKTLEKFVKWGFQQFPARHHGLIVWNHGAGIFDNPTAAHRTSTNDIHSNGFAFSDKSKHHMNTADLTAIAKAGAAAAGHPLDLLGLDMCLMGHLEVAYQLGSYAKYLVASEQTEPAPGWDYRAWLEVLSQNPLVDGHGLGAEIVQSYGDSYQKGGSQYAPANLDNTLSLMDVDAVRKNLVPELHKLAEQLKAGLPQDRAAIQDARAKAQQFDNKDCADLGSFLNHLIQSRATPAIRAQAGAVLTSYRSAIPAEAHVGPNVADASGMVIYFPHNQKEWHTEYADPTHIGFAAENWSTFLQAYLGIQ